jgi:hypothetical protein
MDPADVEMIRALLSERRRLLRELSALSFRAIGEKFDISANTIQRIDEGTACVHEGSEE